MAATINEGALALGVGKLEDEDQVQALIRQGTDGGVGEGFPEEKNSLLEIV